MRVLVDNDVSKEQWESFYLSNFFSSPFQSYSFYSFFNSIEGLSAKVFACEENNQILALCVVSLQKEKGIQRFFSSRAIVYGGPLLCVNNPKVNDILIKHIKFFYKKKAIYIEFRNLLDYSKDKLVFIENGFNYLCYQNYLININIDFFQKFNSEKRRQIRKSINLGVKLSVATQVEEIIQLYEILYNVYRLKAKKPLPNVNFFLSLFNYFMIYRIGFVTLVKNEQNTIIGGSFCLVDNNTTYDWFRCGLDKEYKDFYPSTLAAYAGMKFGFDMGCNTFDFMGAGLKGEKYGVREFKSQFGGQLVEFGRFIYIHNPFLYKLGKVGLNVLKLLK